MSISKITAIAPFPRAGLVALVVAVQLFGIAACAPSANAWSKVETRYCLGVALVLSGRPAHQAEQPAPDMPAMASDVREHHPDTVVSSSDMTCYLTEGHDSLSVSLSEVPVLASYAALRPPEERTFHDSPVYSIPPGEFVPPHIQPPRSA